MKLNIIFILVPLFACLLSCQTRAQVENLDTANVVRVENSNAAKIEAKTNQAVTIQPADAPTAKPLSPNNINLKVGIVQSNQNEVCLTTRNYDLAEGTAISVVFLNKLQTVKTAIVQEKLAGNCSLNPMVNPDDSFYSVKFTEPVDEPAYNAVGLITPNKVVVSGDAASVDLDNDKKAEYFRKCTDNEGVHLSVWTGKPLIGKRIWHNYIYLRYDVEPTCLKKDFEGLEN